MNTGHSTVTATFPDESELDELDGPFSYIYVVGGLLDAPLHEHNQQCGRSESPP